MREETFNNNNNNNNNNNDDDDRNNNNNNNKQRCSDEWDVNAEVNMGSDTERYDRKLTLW